MHWVWRKETGIFDLSASARRRKVNQLSIFAPLRDQFHAAIFLWLLRFCIDLALAFNEYSLRLR